MNPDPETADRVVITRDIAAPTDVVWKMWTDPHHFAQWYGPAGATIAEAAFDLRVGGTRRVCMAVDTPNGPMRMWFGGTFESIDEPLRLVYSEYMCDENGAQTAVPAGHPTTTTIVVELADCGKRTRMTMTHIGIPEGSPGARGWVMAFDKLELRISAGVMV